MVLGLLLISIDKHPSVNRCFQYRYFNSVHSAVHNSHSWDVQPEPIYNYNTYKTAEQDSK